VINRSSGGKERLYNEDGSVQAEARCPECERLMHERYRHGNLNDPPQQRVNKKQRHHKQYQPRQKQVKPTHVTHKNHIQPVWYYFTYDEMEVAYYYREVRNGGRRGGQPTTGSDTPQRVGGIPPDPRQPQLLSGKKRQGRKGRNRVLRNRRVRSTPRISRVH